MSIPTSYFATDLANMIADIPATFTFGALSFPCSVADLTQDQTLILAGNLDKRAIHVIFPASAIASASTPFISQNRVQVQRPGEAAPVNYQISTVELSPDNVSITTVLMQDNRT